MSNRRRRDPYKLVGTRLDRYSIQELVGIGGMGAVYRAVHANTESVVALKILKPDLAFANPSITSLFLEEARKTASLMHPGITKVFDADITEDGLAFLVMEWLEGATLEQVLKSKRWLPLDQIVILLEQVCAALAYAHSKGIVHQDLKPGNFMVVLDHMNDERVMVMDFGIARVSNATEDDVVSKAVGSPYYASPEQLLVGSKIDNRTDIYSLGVTLYQLITGRLPFNDTSLDILLSQQLSAPPPPLREIRPDVDSAIEEVISRAMAKKPDNRYKHVDELLEAFIQAVEQYYSRSNKTAVKKLTIITGAQIADQRDTSLKSQADTLSITRLREKNSPTNFFDVDIFSRSRFFEEEKVRFTKIEETLNFYRNHLQLEYESLLKQVNIAYTLWLSCVGFGFIVFVTGLIMLFLNKLAAGALTTASSATVYFIQRIFHQREEYYRTLAAAKYRHLEFGNEWLLVIQSIDAIEDPKEKMKQQARLANALTEKLKSTVKDVTK